MLNKKRLDAFRLLKFTPVDKTICARLPPAYKKFQAELMKAPKPVYFQEKQGIFEKNPETGAITPVQNVPIPTRFPKELNQVLLGGERVIRGFTQPNVKRRRIPRFWVPTLKRSVVYSEILNKHFSAIVTDSLICKVHEHKGFDSYLLESEACDLRSFLALKMKRRLLTALLEKDLPYDEKKNAEIYNKYKQYIIPQEELEWFGLTLREACNKQLAIEEADRTRAIPLKIAYRQELLEELKSGIGYDGQPISLEEKPAGWLSKIAKPFASSKTD